MNLLLDGLSPWVAATKSRPISWMTPNNLGYGSVSEASPLKEKTNKDWIRRLRYGNKMITLIYTP